MRAPRKTNSIARAVTITHRYGGDGSHFALNIRKGRKADAVFRVHASEESFDAREARQATLDLRVFGSIRRAVEFNTNFMEAS